MIPKIIHYCWFGRNPMPQLAIQCMASWKKFCPDYKIRLWNEDNFDISSCPLYVRQAYDAGKWAFVTDYVRLRVVYTYGGIYLDTDVELKRPLNTLRKYKGYFGFEDDRFVATGLGFGAEQGLPLLKDLMADYEDIPFRREDGTFDLTPCPKRNTKIFIQHGLVRENKRQILDEGILILPRVYLCPIRYEDGVYTRSWKTLSVHHFAASWQTEQQQTKTEAYRQFLRKIKQEQRWDYIKHLPNRAGKAVLGEKGYQRLKKYLKKGR